MRASAWLYTGLSGRSEGIGPAVSWAAIHVAPVVLAFEIGKWRLSLKSRLALLAGAALVSLAAQVLAGLIDPAFDALRRLPPVLLVVALLAAADRLRPATSIVPSVPLEPARIDWIEASANYVVAHGCRRTE